MTRLLDVLMRNPRNTERGRLLRKSLTGLVPFIVDNVAAYCAEQPGSTLTWGDFPIARAMHICRGHFKHFDEKPLFGKHRGMFFWGDQVRNTESNRAVAKRYDVHPGTLIVADAPGTISPLRPESKSA